MKKTPKTKLPNPYVLAIGLIEDAIKDLSTADEMITNVEFSLQDLADLGEDHEAEAAEHACETAQDAIRFLRNALNKANQQARNRAQKK